MLRKILYTDVRACPDHSYRVDTSFKGVIVNCTVGTSSFLFLSN